MILGKSCTRFCRFCNVSTQKHSHELPVDPDEPQKIADSIKEMGLDYVVITMVHRDDLADGGASHLSQVLRVVRTNIPSIKVEVLTGDFQSDYHALNLVLSEHPVVFAHNVEVVERLTALVRDPRANYQKSLAILNHCKHAADAPMFTKSSLMLGLGESLDEIVITLEDLRRAEVDFVTIGQYLQPSKVHLAVEKYWSPEEFEKIGIVARNLGFLSVASGPHVRSSYQAREFYLKALSQ